MRWIEGVKIPFSSLSCLYEPSGYVLSLPSFLVTFRMALQLYIMQHQRDMVTFAKLYWLLEQMLMPRIKWGIKKVQFWIHDRPHVSLCLWHSSDENVCTVRILKRHSFQSRWNHVVLWSILVQWCFQRFSFDNSFFLCCLLGEKLHKVWQVIVSNKLLVWGVNQAYSDQIWFTLSLHCKENM